MDVGHHIFHSFFVPCSIYQCLYIVQTNPLPNVPQPQYFSHFYSSLAFEFFLNDHLKKLVSRIHIKCPKYDTFLFFTVLNSLWPQLIHVRTSLCTFCYFLSSFHFHVVLNKWLCCMSALVTTFVGIKVKHGSVDTRNFMKLVLDTMVRCSRTDFHLYANCCMKGFS